MKRTSRTLILAMSIGLLIIGATGCGSSSDGGGKKQATTTEVSSSATESDTSSAGKPDTAAIAKGIKKAFSVSQGQATCVAEKLKDKLPAKALRAVARAKPSDTSFSSGELDKITKELGAAIAACQ